MNRVVGIISILVLWFSAALVRTSHPVVPDHNVLFVLAHPDDESMFMVNILGVYHEVPTILALNKSTLYFLYYTNGFNAICC